MLLSVFILTSFGFKDGEDNYYHSFVAQELAASKKVEILSKESVLFNKNKIFYRAEFDNSDYVEEFTGDVSLRIGQSYDISITNVKVLGNLKIANNLRERVPMFKGQHIAAARYNISPHVMCLVAKDYEIMRCMAKK